MNGQVFSLAPAKTPHQGFKQLIPLSHGTYQLIFSYAPSNRVSAEQAIFYVYWNGMQLTRIRPFDHKVVNVSITVEGVEGINSLEIVDASTSEKKSGAIIDDVGLYPWKRNNFNVKEIEAVGAGFSVTASTWLNVHHMDPQLDADESNTRDVYPCWCPIRLK